MACFLRRLASLLPSRVARPIAGINQNGEPNSPRIRFDEAQSGFVSRSRRRGDRFVPDRSAAYRVPMLFKRAILAKVRTGEVSVAFRRWTKPSVKAGGYLVTSIGRLAIDEVRPWPETEIT